MAKKKPNKDVTPVKKEKPEGYVFGRPIEYKPEYCDMLIEHMAGGLSFESFAGVISVSDVTLHNWASNHEDFFKAKQLAFQKCRLWWETQSKNGLFSMNGVSMNPTVYRLNMINRFKWKDKAEEDKKIELDLTNLSDEELEKQIEELENGKTSEPVKSKRTTSGD